MILFSFILAIFCFLIVGFFTAVSVVNWQRYKRIYGQSPLRGFWESFLIEDDGRGRRD